ncbi:hypothetical protein Nm8I071_37570 [Nonomuraea sp. TT08I-71]|nr:hypothetical protein Nm8I071_37570 [Nonomuraea sp. TT08I-71]
MDRVDGETLGWSWATVDESIFRHPLEVLPDDEPSIVRLSFGPDSFTLRHGGVLGRHSFALGMICDHLLGAVASYRWMRRCVGKPAR